MDLIRDIWFFNTYLKFYNTFFKYLKAITLTFYLCSYKINDLQHIYQSQIK